MGRKIREQKQMILFFILRFFQGLGAVIPIYASLILKSTDYYSVQNIGYYETALYLGYGVMSVIGGRLTDWLDEKKLLLFSNLICVTAILLYNISGNPNVSLIAFLVLYGCYSLSCPAITTLSLEAAPEGKVNGVFSMLFVGLSLSTCVWSIVISAVDNMNHFLWIVLAADLVAFLLVLFGVKENRTQKAVEEEIGEEDRSGFLKSLWKRKYIMVFSLFMTIFMFDLAQLNVTFPVMMDRMFGENGTGRFAAVVTLNSLVIIAASWPLNHLTKKLKLMDSIILGAVFYIIGYGMLFFVKSYWLILLSTVIWTFGEILANTYGNSFITQNVPKKFTGTYVAVYSVSIGVGSLAGPLFSGALLNSISCGQIYLLVAGMTGAATVGFFVLKKSL